MGDLSGFGSLTEYGVNRISKDFNIKLPKDYKEFLLNNNGCIPTHGYLTFITPNVNDEDNEFMFGALFGVGLDRVYDLYFSNKQHEDDLVESSLIIGYEQTSGYILLVNQDDVSGIYFWDYGYVLSDSSDDMNTYKLCDTFTDFIEMLTPMSE